MIQHGRLRVIQTEEIRLRIQGNSFKDSTERD